MDGSAAGARLIVPVAPRRGIRAIALRQAVAAAVLVAAFVYVVVFLDTDLSIAGLLVGCSLTGAIAVMLELSILRGPDWLAGAAALSGGVLAIAGGGMSASVATAGLGLVVIVGGLSLVVGLGLVGGGLALLVRGLRGWWRLAIVPIAFVLVQFLLLPITVAVVATHLLPAPFTAQPPAGATVVALTTSDGVTLSAWYTPSDNGAAVVLLPGSGGSKATTTGQSAVLARHGYAVLALDARGCGDSGGRQMAWGWQGTKDIAAAVDWLAAQPGVDPDAIGVLGESMGGEQAITAAADDPRIRAVVAEGASARTAADIRWTADGPTGLIERAVNIVIYGASDLMSEAAEPIPLSDAVAAVGDRPLLLITSNDRNDAAAAPLLAARGGAGFRRWDPPNTAHTQALATHPDEWEARVIALFDAALRPS